MRKGPSRHVFASGALITGLAVFGVRAEETEPAYVKACPHAVEAQYAITKRTREHRPKIARVSRPEWQRELVDMVNRDQAARNQWIADGMRTDFSAVESVDRANVKRLKRMLAKDAFPTAAMVGYDGISALWLLLQHADRDPKFQRRWLPSMEARAKAGELSLNDLGMFTDRVFLANGQKQRYGTQAIDMPDGQQVRPVEDPAHLDERRAAMGMIPEEDYLCILRAMYRAPKAGAEATTQ